MKKKKGSQDIEVIDKSPPQETVTTTDESARHWYDDRIGFPPFNTLRKEVDTIFNQFSDRFGLFNRPSTEGFQLPSLDVDETETAFEITAELPGVDQSDIDISVNDSLLTIHGEKQESKQSENADRRLSERSFGVYERTLSLPFKCKAKSIEAQYDNGVLHLTIPKPDKTKSKPEKVKIKSAA